MARHSLRENIIEAAVEQFHSRGFNAAGVKDITDRAGVPKGSFYNHFDSKEALAVVALERYAERAQLEDLVDRSVAPLARLRGHFEQQRAQIEEHGFTRGCLLGNLGAEVADHSDILRAAVEQNLARWTELITEALAEAQQAGSLRPELDPHATARFILSAWEGTLISARADRSAAAIDSFFDLVFGTLLT